MIEVALKDTLESGAFGPLRFGMTREEVESLLGPPVNWGVPTRRRPMPSPATALIWVYGNLEIHFVEDEELLGLIYSDMFDVLNGGPAMMIDPWTLRAGTTRSKITGELRACSIPYQEFVYPYQLDGVVNIVTGGGVELSFYERSSAGKWRRDLAVFSLSAWLSRSLNAAIPLQYRLIGQIEHYWDRLGVVAIRLIEGASLQRGDRIAFHLPPQSRPAPDESAPLAFRANFVEQDVDYLRVDEQPVRRAMGGDLITLKANLSKQQARKNVDVYVIS